MKFAIHDLSYEQFQTALAALNDAGVPHGDTNIAPTIPASTTQAPVTSPAPATLGGVEVDKAGLPWDERIHATTKTQTQKGFWKKRKGVDASVIEAVEQELRLNIPASLDRTCEATPPATPAPVAEQAAPVNDGWSNPAPAAQPTTPPAIPAPVAPPAAPVITHGQMMTQMNTVINDPTSEWNPTHLPALCAEFGISSLNDCVNDPVTIAGIYHRLGGQ